MTQQLLELAERCEAATGPDAKLSELIFDSATFEGEEYRHYTASIDAALTLVPEGWLLQGLMERNASGQHNWRWKADLWRCRDDKTVRGIARVAHAGKAAPALAICAAALRARAAL